MELNSPDLSEPPVTLMKIIHFMIGLVLLITVVEAVEISTPAAGDAGAPSEDALLLSYFEDVAPIMNRDYSK